MISGRVAAKECGGGEPEYRRTALSQFKHQLPKLRCIRSKIALVIPACSRRSLSDYRLKYSGIAVRDIIQNRFKVLGQTCRTGKNVLDHVGQLIN